MKALERERELGAAVGQLVLHDEGDDPRRRELGLQVGQVLALVRSKPGDVDETDHIVSRAGRGDDRTPVGMTDQQDRPADLTDHALEVLAVAACQTAQRIRRSDDRYVFAEKLVVQAAKAGRVSERAMDENDSGIRHRKSPLSSRMNGSRASVTMSASTVWWCRRTSPRI